ncbi:MAG: squalene synthase HpnC [Acidimicrobiales bacterium]
MSRVAQEVRLPSDSAVLAKASAENFPVAFRLLPARVREDLLALYGYARLVDDVGDELEGTPEMRLAALDAVEAELDRAFAGTATHPVFCRLAATISSCGLTRQPFVDLIEANRMDQSISAYETFDDLLGYCRLSADPVGRLVLAVFGESDPENERLSDLICTGLQLVEHFGDVAEDAERDRVYLPREDLARFSVDPVLLGRVGPSGSTPEGLRRLMAFEVTRARAMLIEGSLLVSRLRTSSAAVAVAGYAAGGLAQLDAIERSSYDVVARHVKASDVAVARHGLRLLARRWRSR